MPNSQSAKNEEAGWSQHSMGTFPSPALITATNRFFGLFVFFKGRSCNHKHAKKSLPFKKHFLYCHKHHPFAVVISLRTRCVCESVCCGHSLSRWGIPTPSAAKNRSINQIHLPLSLICSLSAFLFPSFLSNHTKLYLNVTQQKFRKAKDHTL